MAPRAAVTVTAPVSSCRGKGRVGRGCCIGSGVLVGLGFLFQLCVRGGGLRLVTVKALWGTGCCQSSRPCGVVCTAVLHSLRGSLRAQEMWPLEHAAVRSGVLVGVCLLLSAPGKVFLLRGSASLELPFS